MHVVSHIIPTDEAQFQIQQSNMQLMRHERQHEHESHNQPEQDMSSHDGLMLHEI